ICSVDVNASFLLRRLDSSSTTRFHLYHQNHATQNGAGKPLGVDSPTNEPSPYSPPPCTNLSRRFKSIFGRRRQGNIRSFTTRKEHCRRNCKRMSTKEGAC